jgi:enoyl-CoA hydratase/carnithine racemase
MHQLGKVRATMRGELAEVTLERPGKRNAMTLAMWESLTEVIDDVANSSGASAVVVKGADGSFSAGADFGEVLDATTSLPAAMEFCSTVVRGLLAVARCPLPTVAAIQGVAAGGGAEIALAADIRVAERGSSLQLPLGRLGVVPDEFTVKRLVAVAGTGTARRLLLQGRAMTAHECLRVGLVDEVARQGGLDDAVDVLVRGVSLGSKRALRQIKKLLFEFEFSTSPDQLISDMAQSFVNGDVAVSANRFLERAALDRSIILTDSGKETVK